MKPTETKIKGVDNLIRPYYKIRHREVERYEGNLTSAFHHMRDSLKSTFVNWHLWHDVGRVIQQLETDTSEFIDIYKQHDKFKGLRDDFEMDFAVAIALTRRTDLAEKCRELFSFQPCPNGYSYYIGYKAALIGLILDDDDLLDNSKSWLKKYNPSKIFYFPSKNVIYAACEGDMKTLKTNIKNITKKFDGYAKKMKAVSDNGVIDVSKLDMHWFSPYPDWAFYSLAIRKHGPIDHKDSIWMPMEFLNSYSP